MLGACLGSYCWLQTKKGDVLLAWNGADLADSADMMKHLRDHKAGDQVKLKVWRAGKEMELTVTLRAAKPKE